MFTLHIDHFCILATRYHFNNKFSLGYFHKPFSTSLSITLTRLFYGRYRFQNRLISLLLWVFSINAVLIIIFNPSLLNPGPSCLSVFYQNAQGLIPFSHLSSDNPLLDMHKILELQTYANQNRPDIIILNETWLKSSIHDNEILPSNQYNIFRTDRSPKTHPPDANDPKKFRKNGGGVLIAVRSDLEIVQTKIQLPCGAEILAVRLTLDNGN